MNPDDTRAPRTECVYCLTAVDREAVRRCSECGAAYHADCWEEYGGCTVFGCAAWLERQMIEHAPAQPLAPPVALPAPSVGPPAPARPAAAFLPPSPSATDETVRRANATRPTAPAAPNEAWWTE